MKKIINYILVVLGVLAISSCEKFLDVKPAGKMIPESGDVSYYENLLNSYNTISYFYWISAMINPLTYLTDDIEMSENQANYYWYSGHSNIQCYFAYTYKKPYGNPNLMDYYWDNGIYRAVQYFNVIVEGIQGVVTPETEALAKEVTAEAAIARAWSFFTGALGYGPVYKPGGDNSAKVLPYRTSSNVLSPMEPLSTLQEIFDRVLTDIHTYLKYAPDRPTSKVRFGKPQTYAFLAHYHLFAEHYDSVAYYANKCLTMAAEQEGGMDNLFYDMNLFTWSNDASVKANPDLRYNYSVNTPQSSFALYNSYHREMCLYRYSGSAPSASQAYVSTELLALFDKENDLRCEYYFFQYPGYKTTVGGISYNDGRRYVNRQGKVCSTNGYTYPEVLLMRAEGYARTNQLTKALQDLNYLRKFRMKAGTPDIAVSGQDNIINEVLKERRRELPAGSHKRFSDLKRFSKEIGKPWAKESVVHYIGNQAYSAKTNSDYFILPIRNTVLSYNPQWGVPLDGTAWTGSK